MHIVMVPTEKLLAPEREMRETMTHEGLEELRESIAAVGLRQPLNVRRKGEFFEVVAGARRLEACKLLKMAEIPCVVVDGDARQIEEIKIHENLKREDVDPVEEARYYRRLVDEGGWNLDELVKATGRGYNYLEQRLEICKWDERVQLAVSGKAISLSVARELMKFGDAEARERFLMAAANNGVTARTMESWRLQYEASLRSAPAPVVPVDGAAAPAAVHTPKNFCAVCGEDLHGLIVLWVPVSQRCVDFLKSEQARALHGAPPEKSPEPVQ